MPGVGRNDAAQAVRRGFDLTFAFWPRIEVAAVLARVKRRKRWGSARPSRYGAPAHAAAPLLLGMALLPCARGRDAVVRLDWRFFESCLDCPFICLRSAGRGAR
jgi:hypothetical protein